MASYIRGSMVFFSATFVDAAGSPATPSAATLYLVYVDSDGVRQKTSATMSVVGNVATASWDSSDATAPGKVYWSIKGTGSNAIVQDGSFDLTANESNPVL
jgi:hypothetical protein